MKIDDLLSMLKDDIGFEDITSSLLPDKRVKAKIVAKEDLYVSGTIFIKAFFEKFKVNFEICKKDGEFVKKGENIATLEGNVKTMLTLERTALNLLQRMSGITTATQRCVEIAGPKVKIAATRKTILRYYDKFAVVAGGGDPHRWRLDDMFLIKDNHIRILGITQAVRLAKKRYFSKKIEVEVGKLEEALEAAYADADIIMFDNMPPQKITENISMLRDKGFKKLKFEASGNINLQNLREYAKSGVDIISMGWLTHTARACDISMEINGD
ncbi:MAG: carboxylating nicotinate-nucleotide diphosphorylase [Candidatus Methanofastidiosia archaeon]